MGFLKQFNVLGCGIQPIVRAVARRSRVLVIHDQSVAASGDAGSFDDYLYTALAGVTSRMAGAWGSGRTSSGTTRPVAAATGTLTNLSVGIPFEIYDRPAAVNPAKNTGSAYALLYDTASTAGDGTAGDPVPQLPCGSQEIIAGAASGPGNGQLFFTFTATAHASISEQWQIEQVRATFYWHEPAANNSGTRPITGGLTFAVGLARGSGTPTADVAVTGGTANTIRKASTLVAAGAGLPSSA